MGEQLGRGGLGSSRLHLMLWLPTHADTAQPHGAQCCAWDHPRRKALAAWRMTRHGNQVRGLPPVDGRPERPSSKDDQRIRWSKAVCPTYQGPGSCSTGTRQAERTRTRTQDQRFRWSRAV